MNESKEDEKKDFSMICRPTQCLFCLGDEMLLYSHRIFEYFKSNKMMNETKQHLKRFASKD